MNPLANMLSSQPAISTTPATLSRSGSPPVMRTALRCRSSAMIRSSRRTTSGSKDSRELRRRERAGAVVDALAVQSNLLVERRSRIRGARRFGSPSPLAIQRGTGT
jgi:hypothetical protein